MIVSMKELRFSLLLYYFSPDLPARLHSEKRNSIALGFTENSTKRRSRVIKRKVKENPGPSEDRRDGHERLEALKSNGRAKRTHLKSFSLGPVREQISLARYEARRDH